MDDLMLYIVRGIPGSGKSQIAEILAPEHHYEANDYFYNPKTGEFKYNPYELDKAHKKCFKNVENAMMRGVSKIAVANTFVKKWEYEPYVECATKLGYTVFIIICKGSFVSPHDIPDSKIRNMMQNFEY